MRWTEVAGEAYYNGNYDAATRSFSEPGHSMDTPLIDLEIGNMYYKCECIDRDGQPSLVVSTWIYLGIVSHRCTSPDCDEPYRYYKFSELESHRAAKHQPEISENVAHIPSLAQVSRVMLDFSTFGSDVAYWVDAIRNGTAYNSETDFRD